MTDPSQRIQDIKSRLDRYSMPEPNSGCWLWIAGTYGESGYGAVCVGDGKNDRAHRVSYAMKYGPIPDGLYVLHKCDIRTCINPDHLFLGTHQDNMDDMLAKGRNKPGTTKGASIGTSKLTESDALEIARRCDGAPYGIYSKLAREYGVDHTSIRNIATGRTWAHVTGIR